MEVVSVIVLSYNQSEYIERCLESVFNQSYKNLEVIVSDDCSTDETDKKIAALKRIYDFKFIKREKNLGLVKNLNLACKEAKGDYVALVAADDLWQPDKIKIQKEYMRQHKETAVCGGYVNIIDKKGNIIKSPDANDIVFKELNFDEIMLDNYMPAPTIFIRNEYLKMMNYFDEKYKFEDWQFLLKTLNHGYKIVILPYLLASYRVHNKNYHHNFEEMLQEGIKILNEYKNKKVYKEAIDKYVYFHLKPLTRKNKKIFFRNIKYLSLINKKKLIANLLFRFLFYY